jgi:DNA-binding LytR/AlgR family response regulator
MSAATAIIVDDEPLLRAQLREMLAVAWPALEIVGEAGSGAEAVHLAREKSPQVVFLDIEMPGMNGLEAARALKGLAHVVFVTAYNQYAVEAFDRGALDYVLKPASQERLAETVSRLKERVSGPPAVLDGVLAGLAKLVAPTPAAARLKWIQASVGANIRLINVDDVLFFQSDAKYTRVVTAEGEALVRKALKELLVELDCELFWQVHRATIVNIRAIAAVTIDAFGHKEISLKGRKDRLEVSRTFAHLFKAS